MATAISAIIAVLVSIVAFSPIRAAVVNALAAKSQGTTAATPTRSTGSSVTSPPSVIAAQLSAPQFRRATADQRHQRPVIVVPPAGPQPAQQAPTRPSQTASVQPTVTDLSVPLDTFQMVSLDGYSLRIAVHDDGPDEIRVVLGYSNPVRLSKNGGFESGQTETPIYSHGKAELFYVNEIHDHIGHCKLRLRSR